MGVNCYVRLPGNVRISHVCTVIGRLVGFPTVREDFSQGTGWHATNQYAVKGMHTSDFSPELLNITWTDSADIRRHMTWSFEGKNNTRTLIPQSTAFWCALSARLVEFFGGELTFSDITDDIDLSVPAKSDAENCPSEDPDWSVLQQRILDLKPITLKEMMSYSEKAAYGIDDDYTYLFNKEGYMVIPNRKEKVA